MANELRFSRLGNQLWAIVVEDGRVAEIYPEFPDERGFAAGALLLARVQRVVPQLGAAFVMLARGEEGFLEASDLPGAGDPDERLSRLVAGSALIVQVRRVGRGDKRPRVSARPELSSTRLSFRPLGVGCKLSRRITDAAERERLRRWGAACSVGELVIRTAAQGVAEADLDHERDTLIAAARKVATRAQELQAPATLQAAPSIVRTLIQDFISRGLERVVVETAADERTARESLVGVPTGTSRVTRFGGPGRLFHYSRLDRLLVSALDPHLKLDSGATLAIEPTEALWAIDVNAAAVGHSATRKHAALQINLEAATEVARQIRLRDLSGTLVIDFLQARSGAERERILERLRDKLRVDRRYHRLAGWTPLGLCEVARRRDGPSLTERLGSASHPTPWGRATRILSEVLERAGRHVASVDSETARALERSIEGTACPLEIEIDAAIAGPSGYRLRRRSGAG